MSVQIRFHGGPQDGKVQTFDESIVGMVIHAADTYTDSDTVAYKLQSDSDAPFTYTVEDVA